MRNPEILHNEICQRLDRIIDLLVENKRLEQQIAALTAGMDHWKTLKEHQTEAAAGWHNETLALTAERDNEKSAHWKATYYLGMAREENKRLREALVPIVEAWEHYKDDLFLSNKAEAKPKPICSCWPYLSNLWCAIRLSIRTKNSNEINMGDLLGQLRVWPDKLTR